MPNPITVLVVDDDPALVSAARALLARRGCHLEAAYSGLEAIARVRAGGIDAVLLDVWMPEVNGLSVLQELSSLAHAPRIVLMTGRVDDKVEQAIASGLAVACLKKPVDFDLAWTLLANEAPDRPLQLRPELDPAALAAFAAQALSRGTAFLEDAPGLPPGVPVSIQLTTPSGELSLLAVAEAGRPAGKRGLQVRLSERTMAQEQALRSVGAPPAAEAAPLPQPAQGRAQELHRRALERMESGRYDKALLDLRAARELAPDDPLIHAALLRAEELAGMEKARSLFREAQEVVENDPQQALRLVEDAIRLDPHRAAYHREAARLYLRHGGSIQQAEERLGAAIHLAPSDPGPRLLLVQLLDRAGRLQEAIWACEAARQLFPGDDELQKLAIRLKRKAPGPSTGREPLE